MKARARSRSTEAPSSAAFRRWSVSPRSATTRTPPRRRASTATCGRYGLRRSEPPATLAFVLMPQLGSFEKALRVGEGRRLKRLREQADYITSLEPEFEDLSDDELAQKTV